MANTISNLLVGIGFEVDKKSEKLVGQGIDRIKSKALQLGAVVAGAFGIKALTSDFANATNMLSRFAEVNSLAAGDLTALGSALAENGGSLESGMQQLSQLEKFRAGLLQGDADFIGRFGIAQGDAQAIIDAKDSMEAYVLIADQFKNATPQQRINLADSLGFGNDGLLLLSKGSAEVEATLDKYRNIRPLTDQMTEASNQFNRNLVESKSNIGAIADAISTELLGALNEASEASNNWFKENGKGAAEVAGGATKSLFNPIDSITSLFDGSQDDYFKEQQGKNQFEFLPDWLGGGNDESSGGFLQAPEEEIKQREQTRNEILNWFGFGDNKQQAPVPGGVGSQSSNGSQLSSTSQTTNATQQTVNVNASFSLDGTVIDRKIMKVVDGMAQTAIEDIASNNGG